MPPLIDTISDTKKKLFASYLVAIVSIFLNLVMLTVLYDNEVQLSEQADEIEVLRDELEQTNLDYIKTKSALGKCVNELEYQDSWRSELNKKFPNQLPIPPLPTMKG